MRYPSRMPSSLLLATSLALAGAPTVLPVPPQAHTIIRPVPTSGQAPPRLKQKSATPNQITDTDAWFATNGLALPLVADPPPWVPATVGDLPRLQVINQGSTLIATYGRGYDASVLLVFGPNGNVRGAFDFTNWLTPVEALPGDEAFVHGGVRWAWVVEEVLYVTTSHRTYSASSKGKNAFLSAIDLGTGALRWQSDPLVCNAQDFVVIGDSLVCGYGFTAESDALYVLDRATGAVLSSTKLKTGPDYFIVRGEELFVRTYNTDYVFSITR